MTVQAAYYCLQAIRSVITTPGGIPETEPAFADVVKILGGLLSDARLSDQVKDNIRSFLLLGNKWESVRTRLLDPVEFTRVVALIDSLTAELGKLLASRPSGSGFDFTKAGVELVKVVVPGFENDLPLEKTINSGLKHFSLRASRKGDPFVYLHNPLREKMVYARAEMYLEERFPESLRQLISACGVTLYVCEIEEMLGDLASRFASGGVLRVAAVGKIKQGAVLSNRVPIIVFSQKDGVLVPVAYCFGGVMKEEASVHIQTLAFVFGLEPDDVQIKDGGGMLRPYVGQLLPSRQGQVPVMLGWWGGTLIDLLELHLKENVRRVLIDVVIRLTQRLGFAGGASKDDAFSRAKEAGFTWASVRSEMDIVDLPLRSSFAHFLSLPLESFADKEKDQQGYLGWALLELIRRSRFVVAGSDDKDEQAVALKKDMDQRKDEVAAAVKRFTEIGHRRSKGYIQDWVRRREHWKSDVPLTSKAETPQGWMEAAHYAMQPVPNQPNGKYPWFSPSQFRLAKLAFERMEATVLIIMQSLRGRLDELLGKRPFHLGIGSEVFLVYPMIGHSVADSANFLINRGYADFLFYGTTGAIKNIPEETFVVPESIYSNSMSVRVAPEMSLPVPVPNMLIAPGSKFRRIFDTDSFYKTDHYFVASTHQEHEGWFARMIGRAAQYKGLTVEVDLPPLARVCAGRANLGAVLFVTDIVAGRGQIPGRKTFYMRWLFLSLIRGFGKEVQVDGVNVDALVATMFREEVDKALRGLLG